MARSDDQPRIFTKDVDGETKTRRVFTEQDAVAAKFDGFFETKATKSTAGGSGAGSTNTGPAAK